MRAWFGEGRAIMAKRVVKIVLSTALVWAVASMAEHWTAQAFASQAKVAKLSHVPTMAPITVEE